MRRKIFIGIGATRNGNRPGAGQNLYRPNFSDTGRGMTRPKESGRQLSL
jgi:hypothetical protein